MFGITARAEPLDVVQAGLAGTCIDGVARHASSLRLDLLVSCFVFHLRSKVSLLRVSRIGLSVTSHVSKRLRLLWCGGENGHHDPFDLFKKSCSSRAIASSAGFPTYLCSTVPFQCRGHPFGAHYSVEHVWSSPADAAMGSNQVLHVQSFCTYCACSTQFMFCR